MLARIYLFALIFALPMSAMALGKDSGDSLFTLYAKNSMGAQSGDCYGDYLVLVTKQESKFGLYNLKQKKLCNVYRCEAKTEMRGKSDVYHANNSTFGIQRFQESTPFPLFYVSNRVNNKGRGVLDVFRLVPMKSDEVKDYDSLSVQQVQTIYFPEATDENALGSPWTGIDREKNCMYTYSRNNRRQAVNKGFCRISKFRIPSVDEGREVYMNDKDILDSYEVDFKAPFSQGACIHKGKLYIAQGVSPKKYLWLRVIDLEQRKLVRTYDLKEAGFPSEPEGCYIFNNHLMLSTAGKRIFIINIPIE